MRARLESRLRKAEKILGAQHRCRCGPGGEPSAVYYFPDNREVKPSRICPARGGHRAIIGVVYELPQFPNYHTDEAERLPLAEQVEPFSQLARYE